MKPALFPYSLSAQVHDGFVRVGMTEHSSPCRLQWQKHRISFPGVHGSAVVSTGQMVPRALRHIWEPWLLKRAPSMFQPLRGCGDSCEGWQEELRSVVSLRKRSLWKTRHLFLIVRIISWKRNQVSRMFYEIPMWSWKLQEEKINSKKPLSSFLCLYRQSTNIYIKYALEIQHGGQ